MLKHKVESDERMAMAVEKGRGGEMSDTNVNLPLKPGDGPGLLITKITKVNGELHSRYRSLSPHHTQSCNHAVIKHF